MLARESDIKFDPALIRQLQSAQSVVVLTGSGVSAESGVPTFRDAQTGLWAQYDPQELATPRAFRQNPRLVWDWYAWRRELVAAARPNPGHYALAELEPHFPDFTLVTQNVDGLHRLAGNLNVVELHGNIMRTKCSQNGHLVDTWTDDNVPPWCPICASLLRPDVVWFGEALQSAVLTKTIKAAERCDVFFSIGTSSVVEPAASLYHYAYHNGATLVEINTNWTPFTQAAHFVIQHPSGQALPTLVRQAINQGS